MTELRLAKITGARYYIWMSEPHLPRFGNLQILRTFKSCT